MLRICCSVLFIYLTPFFHCPQVGVAPFYPSSVYLFYINSKHCSIKAWFSSHFRFSLLQNLLLNLATFSSFFFFLPCTVFFRVGGWGLLSCSASTLVVFFLFLPFSHRPHFCSADSTQLVGFLCVPHVKLNHLNLLFDFVPRGLHLTPKEHRERRPLTPLLVFPFVVRSTPAV